MSDPTRRTSGEIINATLLEVFLALTFVVFSTAVFERAGRETAEAKADSANAKVLILRGAEDQLKSAQAVIASLMNAVDSLTAKSKIPPYCEPGVSPLEIVTITLDGPDRVVVVPTRGRLGLSSGEAISISPAGLRERFSNLVSYGIENHNCRFVARVVDTPRISKADLKRLCSRIQSVFRVQGCFA